MNSSRDTLSELLNSWRITPASNPEFRPSVFARIAALRRSESWSRYVRAHAVTWAVAGLVVVGVAGWTGLAAGRAKAQEYREQAIAAYVASVDPRAQTGLRP